MRHEGVVSQSTDRVREFQSGAKEDIVSSLFGAVTMEKMGMAVKNRMNSWKEQNVVLFWKVELYEYFSFVVQEVNITLLAQGYRAKPSQPSPFFA